ncbi:hypothetical protein [Kangiella taiwanensis]|uniref:Uncharacterized protein n=1 Tax=Kangiella taiwanensis TaxID=1079179 RepID=A0ABP8HW40_9GAMM|nr:hypothetical protein [Kangiella taiwanensis]
MTLVFVSDAKAADAVYECHNCATYQYKQKAYQVIPKNAYYGNWDVYIVDVKNNLLKRYSVFLETDPAFPTGVFKTAFETTPESSFVNKFNDLVASYNDLKGAIDSQKIDYPDGSAFDLRGGSHTALESRISDYIVNDTNIVEYAAYYLTVASSIVGLITSDTQIIVTIHFADGSKVDMKLIGATESLLFEYVEGSVRDGNGNSIPDSQADFNGYYGEFTTHDDSLSRWLQWAEMNGIPITYGGSGGRVEVYCYNEPGGTVCVYKRLQY